MADLESDRIFRELDHTADLRVEIYGTSEEELFRNSVLALYSLLGLPDAAQCPAGSAAGDPLTLHGMDREDVLVKLLGELLYLAVVEGRRLVPGRLACLRNRSDNTVELRVEGAFLNLDLDKAKWRHDIKAVTYHDTKILRTPQGYVATVVMDL